jgi:hypothetical protein
MIDKKGTRSFVGIYSDSKQAMSIVITIIVYPIGRRGATN